MSLIKQFRKIHRKTALIVTIPLFISAITGISYGLLTNWFGISEENGELFLVIHQGEYLGNQLKSIYVILVGLGLMGMVVTGLIMISQNWRFNLSKSPNERQIHKFLAPIFFAPLTITAVTGVIYRVGISYFGLSETQAEIFMIIHQGEYLGKFGQSIYILLIGLGLMIMLVTGIRMTPLFRKHSQKN